MTSKELLEKYGYTIIQSNEMKTGFICDYSSGKKGPMLAVRCDMDGLLVNEQSSKTMLMLNLD